MANIKKPTQFFVVLFIAIFRVQAQSFSPSCVVGSGITTLPACNYFVSNNDACTAFPDRTGRQGCLCKQQVLDAIIKYWLDPLTPFASFVLN
jgi:hypothetical protein